MHVFKRIRKEWKRTLEKTKRQFRRTGRDTKKLLKNPAVQKVVIYAVEAEIKDHYNKKE